MCAGIAAVLVAATMLWRQTPAPSSPAFASGAAPRAAAPAAMTDPVLKPSLSHSPAAALPAPGAVTTAELPFDPTFAEFDAWAEKLAQARSAQPELVAQGETLVRARFEKMTQLIRDNPEEALARALPYRLRKVMPASLAPYLEQPVGGRGDFKVVVSSLPHGAAAETADPEFRVTLGQTRYQAFTYGARLRQPSRRHVPLHGIALTDAGGRKIMALSEDALRILGPEEVRDIAASGQAPAQHVCPVCARTIPSTEQATVAVLGEALLAFDQPSHAQIYSEDINEVLSSVWPEAASPVPPTVETDPTQTALFPAEPPQGHTGGRKGNKRLLYMPVLFADDPIPPQSQDGAQATCANMARVFKENSYGSLNWFSTVTPLLRLPERKTAYADGIVGGSPVSVVGDALAVARTLGYLGPYDDTYVLFNSLNPVVTFGGRSDSLLNGSPGALPHEMGHSFCGWVHANYIDLSGRNPGPRQPGGTNYPIDSDSVIGRDDINAPVPMPIGKPQMVVYGDPYDIMGGGGGHFNVVFKNSVNWLTDQYIRYINSNQTNRIYAFDVPRIFDGRLYALRIRKDYDKEYWISHRQAYTDNPWMSHGAFVQWKSVSSAGNTLLVDTTYASTAGKNDCAVTVGRTLADPPAHIYITPVAEGGNSPTNKWVDVVVNIGPFPTNEVPTVSVTASALRVNPGEMVTFTATAQDPNADVLAYNWQFGDLSFGPNAAVVSNSWTAPGQYVVRCEASDMRGGVASAYVVVTVGNPDTLTMSGRVVDLDGNPIQGARVHNGAALPPPIAPPEEGEDPPPQPILPTTHRYSYTDSQGYFTIGNIPPGTYTNRAYLYGYIIRPKFYNPIELTDANATGLDHEATPITRLNVERIVDAPEISATEDPAVTNAGLFRITRDGDLSRDLLVRYRLDGTARFPTMLDPMGGDYLAWDGNWWTNIVIRIIGGRPVTNYIIRLSNIGTVTIPAGQAWIDMPVVANDNGAGDGDKSVILTLLHQTNDLRIVSYLTNVIVTNIISTNAVYYHTNTEIHYLTNNLAIPGWELIPTGPNNQLVWEQAAPPYVMTNAEARLWILDDEPPNLPVVSVQAIGDVAEETYNGTGMFMFTRGGAPLKGDLVVRFAFGGTASNGLDYVTPPNQVTIKDGESFALLPIESISDLFVEGPETVTVSIIPDNAFTVAGASSSIVILDDNLPQVTVYASDSVAGKTGNGGRITMARTGDLSEPLVVSYLVSGTAVAGRDYQALPQTVTIPAGSITGDIPITPIDNTLPGARTVIIQIAHSPAYNVDYQDAATVSIQDNLPVVTLSGEGGASEAGGPATITVTRTGDTANNLLVYFAVGGSAVEGSDYSAIGTNVLIPAGSATAAIVISARNANDDVFREQGDRFGSETVILQLLPGPDYNLGATTSRSLQIGDNDGSRWPQVGFMLKESRAREGSFVNVMVKCSANPEENLPINFEFYKVSGNAVEGVNYVMDTWMGTNMVPIATWGDNGIETNLVLVYNSGHFTHFTPPNPPADFLNPEDTIGYIPIMILNDGVAAGNKTLKIRLYPPSTYETNFVILTNVTAGVTNRLTNTVVTHTITNAYLGDYLEHTLTILDAGTTLVSVEAIEPAARETGLVRGRFLITHDGPTTAPLTVSYAINGTAAPGSDYVSMTSTARVGTVTIPTGTNQVLLQVIPIDDPEEELPETVELTLIEQTGYSVGRGQAMVTIYSDDGTLQFTSTRYDFDENAGLVTIPVLRSGDTNRQVTVEYAFVDRSAVNGVDYIGTNGALAFAPGQVQREIRLAIVNDPLVEPLKNFDLTLQNPTGGIPLGGQRQATVYIHDDDVAFTFATNTFVANENGTNARIQVLRVGLTNNPASVRARTSDGTATNALDYASVDLRLDFASGQTTQTFLVPILDDVVFDGNETANLALSDPSPGAYLTALTNASVLILDDECRITCATNNFLVWEYTGVAAISVVRVGGAVNPVSVDFYTYDRTASNILDYVATNGTLSLLGNEWVPATDGSGRLDFRPGETSKTLYIPLNDDEVGEGNEVFGIELLNLVGPPDALPGAVLLGPVSNAVVTILDDELPGNLDYAHSQRLGSGPNAPVRALALQNDGSAVFGGDFTNVNGIIYNRISRLQSNGVVDPFFNPGFGADGSVYAVAVGPDGKIAVGGAFTRMDASAISGIALLRANGDVDPAFNPLGGALNGPVRALAIQADRKIVLGGEFTQVGGLTRTRLARIAYNGASDTGFAASADGPVHALAMQPDGRILVGGAFTNVSGGTRRGIARLQTNGVIDASFVGSANLNGPVYAVALQPDGCVLVGGAFRSAGGQTRNYLARLNPDGTLDPTFDPGAGPNGPVLAIALTSNGRILIGGDFSAYAGASRNGFARVNGSGSLDASFSVGTGANGAVRALVAQPDTALLIGGDFTTVNEIPRNHLARVHGDDQWSVTGLQFASTQFRVSETNAHVEIVVERFGLTNTTFAVDLTTADITATAGVDYDALSTTLVFAPGEMAKTNLIAIHDDLVVEGNETAQLTLLNAPLNVDLADGGRALLVIEDDEKSVRLSAAAYVVSESGTNAVIEVLREGSLEGKVWVTFETQPGTASPGVDYSSVSTNLAFAEGESLKVVRVPVVFDTQDETMETVLLSLSNPIGCFLIEPSSAVLQIVDSILGLGGADPTWTPGAGAGGAGRQVRSLALCPDGRIMVGGAFSQFNYVPRNHLTRLNRDGSQDATFDPGQGPNAMVTSVAVQPNGKPILAGSFTNVNGASRPYICRLSVTGAVDATFNQLSHLNGGLTAISVQGNGQIVAGGGFTQPALYLTRIRGDGSPDSQFNLGAGADGIVHSVCVVTNGTNVHVIAGGAFNTFNGLPRSRVARLSGAGDLDGAFVPATVNDGMVFAVAVDGAGRVLIGGSFTNVDGIPHQGVARLNADGSLDESFQASVNGIVFALAPQPDGKVLLGGTFTQVNSTNRGRYARLLPDGSLETDFAAGAGADGTVFSILHLPDNSILIGGAFATVDGLPRSGVAKLVSDPAPPLRVEALPPLAGGAWRIVANTVPGAEYVFEAAEDLTLWTQLSRFVANAYYTELIDAGAAGMTHRFYRVRLLVP